MRTLQEAAHDNIGGLAVTGRQLKDSQVGGAPNAGEGYEEVAMGEDLGAKIDGDEVKRLTLGLIDAVGISQHQGKLASTDSKMRAREAEEEREAWNHT